MITMRVECAIGVEPMKSTLCRREPWAAWLRAQERQTSCLGWIRTITWPASGAGGLPVTPPSKERVGEGGFEPPTARFQTAHADQTTLLAEDGGHVGHRNGSCGDARMKLVVL